MSRAASSDPWELLDRGDLPVYRPALVNLTWRTHELLEELQEGLHSEERVLTWLQELTILTLGRLDPIVYQDIARQYRGETQGTLLAAWLEPGARNRSIEEDFAAASRERFRAVHVVPAFHGAFRDLRKDAVEYATKKDAQEDQPDPRQQSHVAMRPALEEIREWQEIALGSLLEGLEDRSGILEWGEILELATHGEIEEDFVTRCYRERSTVSLLTETSPDEAARRSRRLFAAFYILPAFRSGVRALNRRAGEVSESKKHKAEAKYG